MELVKRKGVGREEKIGEGNGKGEENMQGMPQAI